VIPNDTERYTERSRRVLLVISVLGCTRGAERIVSPPRAQGQEGDKSGSFSAIVRVLLDHFLRFKTELQESEMTGFLSCGSDTSDTVFVVNGGRWRFWEATAPKLRKCLKPA
jgi:hypothetical protein